MKDRSINVDLRVIGYLNFKRTALFTFDPRSKENSFATTRTWEDVSKLLTQLPKDADLEWMQMVVSSMVGVGVGGEFVQFLKVKDKLQKMEYYLRDPDNCSARSIGDQAS